ncbi:MAG: chromosomal replication initiator DnaA [Shimia sp.]
MGRQLAFDLPHDPALTRGTFLVAPCNAVALGLLERAFPQGKLLLVGAEASGKSHLARIWATETGAPIVAAADLRTADVPALSQGPLAVEGADAPLADEAVLFHLHNALQAAGHPLLLTARVPAPDWPHRLPDLRSRMEATAMARIEPPSDALLQGLLLKLMADRQLSPRPDVIPYLARMMDRSHAGARRLVARIDALALAEGRGVTRALAARALAAEAPLD